MSDPKGKGEPAVDPSMEDILASIRRILNEDEANGAPAPAPQAAPAEEDPFELTEEMLVADPAPRPRQPARPPEEAPHLPARPAVLGAPPEASLPEASFSEPHIPTPHIPAPPMPEPAPELPAALVQPAPLRQDPAAPEPRVPGLAGHEPPASGAPAPEAPRAEAAAPSTTDLVAPATAAAAAAILGQLARTVAAERGAAVSRGGPSIEDVVREEIRPLLKDWLDTHLPGLVERLVRAEIERVISRSIG